MKLKTVIQKQYQDIVHRGTEKVRELTLPQEGWIRTTRKALGMSAAQLARRQKKTRALVSNVEKAELEGKVTLNTMKSMAESMNCRFVYAIVPEESIERILEDRAEDKAKRVVQTSSLHMALEQQSLSPSQNAAELDRLKREYLSKIGRDFWNDEDI